MPLSNTAVIFLTKKNCRSALNCQQSERHHVWMSLMVCIVNDWRTAIIDDSLIECTNNSHVCVSHDWPSHIVPCQLVADKLYTVITDVGRIMFTYSVNKIQLWEMSQRCRHLASHFQQRAHAQRVLVPLHTHTHVQLVSSLDLNISLRYIHHWAVLDISVRTEKNNC